MIYKLIHIISFFIIYLSTILLYIIPIIYICMCYYYPEVKQLHKTLITPIIFPDLLLAALVCWDIWTIPIPPTSKKKNHLKLL